ncbi:MAG: hypothetical protein ABJB47_04545 [Actinomycetota bacterium]
MAGRKDSRQPGREWAPRRSGPASDDDVLELGSSRLPGPGWRPPKTAALLGVAGLIVGMAVGYAAGHQQGRSSAAPRPRVTTSRPLPSPPPVTADASSLVQSGSQCAMQSGHTLQLGIQVTNQSAALLTLRQITPIEPLGNLRVTTKSWGPCGELPSPQSQPERVLAAGSSSWFTVTFKVLVRCPGALPVQFSVGFDQLGRSVTADLPGFVDLGHVPYSGCPVSH